MRDFWQRLKEAVTGILGAMTGPQRLALMLLVGALVYMAGWTINQATGPAERLLLSSSDPDDVRADAVDALTAKQIKHTLRDGSVYVAPEDHDTAKLELVRKGVLTGSKAFDWLKQTNITATTWQNHRLWQVSIQNEVARILRMSPAIESAEVTYTPPSASSVALGTPESGASASVNVLPRRNHEITTEEAIAIASIVVGAVPELKRERVEIINLRTLTHIPVPGAAGNLWKAYHLRDVETKMRETIEAQVRKLFPHFSVSAMVKLNSSAQEKFDQLTNEDKSFVMNQVTKTLNQTRSSLGGSPSTLEKGSTSIATAGGTTEKKDLTERENVEAPSFQTTKSKLEVGNLIESIGVAVQIPEDLIKTLDPAALKTKVENQIKALGAIVDAKSFQVSVETMPAFIAVVDPPAGPWWKVWGEAILAHINLTTLLSLLVAFFGLYLVYKLVRLSMEPRELREMQKTVAVAAAEGPELVEWGAADTMADQVRGQVREMVQKNPRAVAGVLKRWMGQT